MLVIIVAVVLLGAAAPLVLWSRRMSPDASVPVDPDVLDQREAMLNLPLWDRIISAGVETVVHRVGVFTPTGVVAKIERKIALAGKQGVWRPQVLVLAKLISLGLSVLLSLLVLATGFSGLKVLAAALFIAVGAFAVDGVLGGRAQARQLEMDRALPDVLDSLSISVEAGLGFDGAIQRVIRNAEGPLIDEFGRTLQDIRLGASRRAAFLALLDRTDSADLRVFIRALLQADKTGVPVAKILRVQADEAREKRRQKAEEKAMALPVKLVVPLILCILPALFIVVLGPAAMRISELQFGG